MKFFYKFTTLTSTMLLTLSLFGQNDTLFFLNFNTDSTALMAAFPDPGASDSLWVNYDEDLKNTGTGQGAPSNFFFADSVDEGDTTASGEQNHVLRSVSWLEGFDTSSSNWLISPLIHIVDANATIHWKSAPYQGPAFMDGYAVKIIAGTQDITSSATVITQEFRAAEMLSIVNGDGGTVELDSFEFSNGYIHANGYTLADYFTPANLADPFPLHIGKLEPHSLSLADYAGQTIAIAWHHDSSDDNFIMFDDLLLMGTKGVSGTDNPILTDLRFVTYPNPVEKFLNVMFRLTNPADVQLQIFGQDGKLVAAKPERKALTGEVLDQLDLSKLPAGLYNIVLSVDNQRFTKTIAKK